MYIAEKFSNIMLNACNMLYRETFIKLVVEVKPAVGPLHMQSILQSSLCVNFSSKHGIYMYLFYPTKAKPTEVVGETGMFCLADFENLGLYIHNFRSFRSVPNPLHHAIFRGKQENSAVRGTTTSISCTNQPRQNIWNYCSNLY